MAKLSDIKIDSILLRGKGIRPWNDSNVVKPAPQKTTDEASGSSVNKKTTVSKPLANREQIVSRALANREHSVSKPLAKEQKAVALKKESVSKPLAKPLAIGLANREQTVSKPLAIHDKTKNAWAIETLVGNEKKLLLFLFQKCRLIGSIESPSITTDELKNILQINAVHLRNLIYRLSSKNVIEISKIKNGRSGWRRFKFSKEAFQALSLEHSVSKPLAKSEQTVSKALAKPLAEPLATSPSSSSNYINTTTTGPGLWLSEEWLEMDLSPLSEIGFSKNHLSQLAHQNKLNPQAVQDSIYAFAFDLEKNNKGKKINVDPINFFMGILRNGKPYAPPGNYESPQDKAMRVYLERMREIEKKRAETEKEATSLAFKEWFESLTDAQKRELLPENLRHNARLENNKMLEGAARSHFDEKIWPSKKIELKKV